MKKKLETFSHIIMIVSFWAVVYAMTFALMKPYSYPLAMSGMAWYLLCALGRLTIGSDKIYLPIATSGVIIIMTGFATVFIRAGNQTILQSAYLYFGIGAILLGIGSIIYISQIVKNAFFQNRNTAK